MAFPSVTTDKKNANKGTQRGEGMLERSLRDYGAGRSVLTDKHGALIAGNKTYSKAQELGIPIQIIETDGRTLVVVKRTDLDLDTDKAAKELGIADNRTSEVSLDWDADVLRGLSDDGVDLSQFWFDDELDALLASLNPPVALTDPDAVPEAPKEPITKPGDLWLLGRHRLLCGDCRDFGDVEWLFGDARANVVITSPPYASQRKYDETSGFKPIPPDHYVEWFRDVASNVMAMLADDGSYFLNIKEHCDDGQRSLYVKDLTIAHVREWGWMFIDEFCWRNTKNGVPGTWPNRFKNAWEPVFHFSRAASITFHPGDVGSVSNGAFNYHPDNEKSNTDTPFTGAYKALGYHKGVALPSNVIELAAEGGQGNHSAPFPCALPEFFIKAFSDPGDIAFDPFMGSGTTLIAAEQTGRIGYGAEISASYCDVIVKRWEQFTGQTAELERRAD